MCLLHVHFQSSPSGPSPCHLVPLQKSFSLPLKKNQSANFTPFTPTPPRFHLPNEYYTSASLKVRISLVTILHPRKWPRKLAAGELMRRTAGLWYRHKLEGRQCPLGAKSFTRGPHAGRAEWAAAIVEPCLGLVASGEHRAHLSLPGPQMCPRERRRLTLSQVSTGRWSGLGSC